MFRLTRQVRFAINAEPDQQTGGKPSNAYASFPSLTGLGHYFSLDVSLAGEPGEENQYVRNIRDIDEAVRRLAVPIVERHVRERTFGGGAQVVRELARVLTTAWLPTRLTALTLHLSPFLAYTCRPESEMVRLSQKFEFSATHRLHNPKLSAEENCRAFGKCNNPLGHGHNYEVQVTLSGTPDNNGLIIEVPRFERTVAETVIDRLDHKNLNAEVPEFAETIPSVENIARVIYRLLKPKFQGPCSLASVTVWETPKTWCEYAEG